MTNIEPYVECGATFAEFGTGSGVVDLYICDARRGHEGIHTDKVARKAWRPFPVYHPPKEDR